MDKTYFAFGLGVGTKNQQGDWLEVFFPKPLFKIDHSLWQKLIKPAQHQEGGNATIELTSQTAAEYSSIFPEARILSQSEKPVVAVFLESDEKPEDVPQAYLKLHLLSHRYVKPNQQNLNGMFQVLPNVAWTNQGAIDLKELPAAQLKARAAGEMLHVHSVDKFPSMTNYVVPPGVRIGDAARIRLGAYLGDGSTVMHEGFVNFNAGCEGPNMIEGRISASVFVGSGSDLGGGCSTMGTLSGGNKTVIAIGKQCLIGANAGCGIPLGNHCTIEAGLYITASSKVHVYDGEGKLSDTVKAATLANVPHLLFRRNSLTGAIECLPAKSSIELNEALHAN